MSVQSYLNDPQQRDHIIRNLLDGMGTSVSDVLNHMRYGGSPFVHVLLPQPLRPAPDPPLSTLEVKEITVTVQRYGTHLRLDMSDQDVDKLMSATAERMADQMLRGPIPSGIAQPASSASGSMALTLDDMKRAYNALQQWGLPDPPYPHPRPTPLQRIVDECRQYGCVAIREEPDPARLAYVYVHEGPDGERTTLQIEDIVMVQAHRDWLTEHLVGWVRELHATLDKRDPNAIRCGLCRQVRNPDIEPVMLELPDKRTVEACSAECATAYAMAFDMAREHPGPRTQRQRDQLAYEKDVTDNREEIMRERLGQIAHVGKVRNPWSSLDEPAA